MRKNAKLPRVIGKRIRNGRRSAGLTQEELAHRVGISRSYMGYIEQGRNLASLVILQRIARKLQIKLSEIVK